MGRNLRPYLPGVVFHLTARIQGREALLAGMEAEVVDAIATSGAESDALILAYAVMPNHLHLVVRQGRRPLGRLMLQLDRRVAHRVQRFHGRSGHIFEGRFRDRPCLDPDYLRNAVVYTHLNPVRAGLCASPDDHAWTSHRLYLDEGPGSTAGWCLASGAREGRRLFAPAGPRTPDDLHASYAAFLRWRLERDRLAAGAEPDSAAACRAPDLAGGDAHWMEAYARAATGTPAGHLSGTLARPDLRDLALAVLAATRPSIDLAELRAAGRNRALVDARRAVILRGLRSGHRGVDVARLLGVSEATVSRVAAELRRPRSVAPPSPR